MPSPTRFPVATLAALIEAHRPQDLLQVGLADIDGLIEVSRFLIARDEGQLTLVDERLFNDLSWRPQMRAVRQAKLEPTLELVGHPADRALPDLYFQEQAFDCGILVPGARREENFVSLYYLDKVLAPTAPLLVTGADQPAMAGLLREWVANGAFEVVGQPAGERLPRLERLLRERYARLPALLRERVETWVRPERLRSDAELGLGSAVVVLRKTGEPPEEELDVERLLAELSLPHE